MKRIGSKIEFACEIVDFAEKEIYSGGNILKVKEFALKLKRYVLENYIKPSSSIPDSSSVGS